jgi:hypothetical protein
VHERYADATAVNVWYVDLTSINGKVKFTFYWPEVDKWEGRDFAVEIATAGKAVAGV